ncbi:unnamed protein product [Euphydryas editha]|uniref:Uncharacterized protein n=1 Tax=Euphydryas editha TaxID=104508 RepID=A0AAU9UK73_EUPED|nr:unnamed protein product [Euphydryas editha]
MGTKAIESAIQNLTKIVIGLQNKVTSLEKTILDQNSLINKLITGNGNVCVPENTKIIGEEERIMTDRMNDQMKSEISAPTGKTKIVTSTSTSVSASASPCTSDWRERELLNIAPMDNMHRDAILGDFNLYSCSSQVCNYFEYFVAFCELIQCNTVPNCTGRQLDLVLSGRNNGGVAVVAADEALQPVDAHHPPLAVTVTIAASTAKSAHSDSPHHQQNSTSSCSVHDWSDIYNIMDPDTVLDNFYNKIYGVLAECVPLKNDKQEINPRAHSAASPVPY